MWLSPCSLTHWMIRLLIPVNDSFYKHRIYSDKTIPEALTSRWDWVHEEWGRAVRVEIDRALKAK